MNKKALLIPALFYLSWASAIAQEADYSACARENASRLGNEPCAVKAKPPVVIKKEVEITTTIRMPEIKSSQCEAKIAVQYLQLNTIARVSGTIENRTCAASSGSFVIALSIEDSDNEVILQEFTETWKREDHQAVVFSEEYAIGEDVYLVRARAKKMKCTCASLSKTE